MNDREIVETALKDYLSKEMPAGTEICDPLWWAARIAKVVATALAQLEQEFTHPNPAAKHWHDLYIAKCKDFHDKQAMLGAEIAALEEELEELKEEQIEQEPVAWRNAAIRLGEDLYFVGPNGYYDMTAKQWLDWALSVVNTALSRKEWVGLTDEEVNLIYAEPQTHVGQYAKAIEAKLKEKNA